MKNYQQALMDYLSTHRTILTDAEAEDILDVLFRCYQESRNVDSTEIQAGFKNLDNALSKLSLEDNNRVFMITCELCDRHSHEAFRSGILTGFHLFRELLT